MRTGLGLVARCSHRIFPGLKHTPAEIALAIKFFHCEEIELLDPEDIMGLASSCLRGLIVAGPAAGW